MSDAGTLLYVHGASDRGPGVSHHVALIEERLRAIGKGHRVVACRWGDEVGPTLDRIGLSISDEPGPFSFTVATVGNDDALLLALRDDPMAGLSALGATVNFSPAGPPPPGASDADLVLALAMRQGDELATADLPAAVASIPGGQMAVAVRDAAGTVATSSDFQAARSAPVEFGLLTETIRSVSAIAANALWPDRDDDASWLVLQAALERTLGDALVAVAAGTLLVGYLGAGTGDGVRRWATDVLRPRRRETMGKILGLADILVYQRVGGPIRDVLERDLRSAVADGGQVIVVASSLGGIIAVDTLRQPGVARPDLLVTVGSQSSALRTFGALGDDAALPPFQPWLNVYDPRDFVAFVAQPVWPDQPGITDSRVDLDRGFPDAHGQSYLADPSVYQLIFEHEAVAG